LGERGIGKEYFAYFQTYVGVYFENAGIVAKLLLLALMVDFSSLWYTHWCCHLLIALNRFLILLMEAILHHLYTSIFFAPPA